MDFLRAPGSRRHLLLVLTLVSSGACTSAKLVSSERSERLAGSDPFHDLLVTADPCVAPPPATITRGQALGDLDRVERIVRRGYSGFDVLDLGGLDWNETFHRVRAALNGTPEPIPVDSFRRFLIDALSLTRDGHLAFWMLATHGEIRSGSTGAHQDVFAANVVLTRAGDGWAIERSRDPAASPGSLVLDCAGQALGDLLRLTITGDPPQPAWLLARMSTAPPEPLRCRLRIGDTIRETQLSLHRLRASEPGPLAAAPAFESSGTEILRIRLRNLDDRDKTSMQAFVATAPAARSARAVVADIRGNPGGNDSFVQSWFQGLTAGPLHYAAIDELESEVTLQGNVNLHACRLASTSLNPAYRPDAKRMLATAMSRLEDASARRQPFRRWSVSSPTYQGEASSPFSGTLVVLVDSACGSSCESFVMYARQVPGALIVGENTAGVGVYGEVRPFHLAASRIWMNAGTKWFHDSLGAKVPPEGSGYIPDIWIDSEDASQEAEAIASCLTRDPCGPMLRHAIEMQKSQAAPAGR
jgi:hypothetical protein